MALSFFNLSMTSPKSLIKNASDVNKPQYQSRAAAEFNFKNFLAVYVFYDSSNRNGSLFYGSWELEEKEGGHYV